MTTIDTYYTVAEDYYPGRFGLPWTRRAPVVVDRYPPPAENEDWYAVSHVPVVPRRLPAGNRLPAAARDTRVTDLATSHENTHLMGTGYQARDGYHRFFDEGCANFSPVSCMLTIPGVSRRLISFAPSLSRSTPRSMSTPRSRESSPSSCTSWAWRACTGCCDAGCGGLRELTGGCSCAMPPPGSWARGGGCAITTISRSRGWCQRWRTPARRLVSVITSPSPALMSPLGYLVYIEMCQEGSVRLDDLRTVWRLGDGGVVSFVREGEGMCLWVRQNGRLSPLGMSYLFQDAGLVKLLVQVRRLDDAVTAGAAAGVHFSSGHQRREGSGSSSRTA